MVEHLDDITAYLPEPGSDALPRFIVVFDDGTVSLQSEQADDLARFKKAGRLEYHSGIAVAIQVEKALRRLNGDAEFQHPFESSSGKSERLDLLSRLLYENLEDLDAETAIPLLTGLAVLEVGYRRKDATAINVAPRHSLLLIEPRVVDEFYDWKRDFHLPDPSYPEGYDRKGLFTLMAKADAAFLDDRTELGLEMMKHAAECYRRVAAKMQEELASHRSQVRTYQEELAVWSIWSRRFREVREIPVKSSLSREELWRIFDEIEQSDSRETSLVLGFWKSRIGGPNQIRNRLETIFGFKHFSSRRTLSHEEDLLVDEILKLAEAT